MNKHLNNWLDEVEGKPKNTSNNAINKERVRQGHKEVSLLEAIKTGNKEAEADITDRANGGEEIRLI